MGTAIQNFNDFMAYTGPAILTGPEDIVNEAVKRTYILGKMLRGRGLDEVVRGGNQIQDYIIFDDVSTATDYHPNDTITFTNRQVSETISVPWRHTYDYMAWTKHEVELQVDQRMTRANRRVQYKRLKYTKEQQMWTSLINHVENSLWAPGHNDSSAMEDTGGKKPYSLHVFVNEETNGLPNGWTTIEGLNPANLSKWRPQQVQYDFNDPDDTDGDGDGLLEAFDDMLEDINFVPPDFKRQYFEPESEQMGGVYEGGDDPDKCCIMTSKRGKTLYKQQLRARNDTLVRQQDADYDNPRFAGYEVMKVATLDTAQLYTDGSSSYVTETDSSISTAGPRYYWMNFNYIVPIFHESAYFETEDPERHPNQPFTWHQLVDVWRQLFCRSRQRLGVVYPGA